MDEISGAHGPHQLPAVPVERPSGLVATAVHDAAERLRPHWPGVADWAQRHVFAAFASFIGCAGMILAIIALLVVRGVSDHTQILWSNQTKRDILSGISLLVLVSLCMTQPVSIEVNILSLFLPEGILEWFDVVDGRLTDEGVTLILQEKNIPPLREEHKGKQVISKGFYDITVTDFPIRGKRASLTLRRRRWKVEGEKELLKRDIPLVAEGTTLQREFAAFLKGASRDTRDLFDEYC